MASRPDTSKALSILENIRKSLESHHQLEPGARASVLGQISQLRTAVETPLDSVLRFLSQPMQNVALRVAVELGLLVHLAENPGEALSLGQLASLNASHLSSKSYLSNENAGIRRESNVKNHSTIVDSDLIGRFMRVLTAMGVCDEVDIRIYKANNVTTALAQKGLSSGVKFRYDTEIPCAAKLIEFFNMTGYSNPEDSAASPFQYAFGVPKFQWLADNPEASDNFNRYMTGRREGGTQGSWLDFYPVAHNLVNGAKVDDRSVFCVDVGGGKGHDMDQLHSRFHNLAGKLVLQDLEKVVGSSPIFESMTHNFFQPQPIKGARAYHLRAILHDWPTPECKTILSHIAAAMEPDYSRLILREFILPDKDTPLLGSCCDLLMMVLLAGMERTETQWKELLNDVGLEIVGFWTPMKGGEGVIEAVKKS